MNRFPVRVRVSCEKTVMLAENAMSREDHNRPETLKTERVI